MFGRMWQGICELRLWNKIVMSNGIFNSKVFGGEVQQEGEKLGKKKMWKFSVEQFEMCFFISQGTENSAELQESRLTLWNQFSVKVDVNRTHIIWHTLWSYWKFLDRQVNIFYKYLLIFLMLPLPFKNLLLDAHKIKLNKL